MTSILGSLSTHRLAIGLCLSQSRAVVVCESGHRFQRRQFSGQTSEAPLFAHPVRTTIGEQRL